MPAESRSTVETPPEAPSALLVDDHPENLAALEVILEPLPVILVKAQSGAEALKHLLSRDFAVILLDVRMPGMSGFETAELIWKRERSRSIPIIFLTAAEADQPEIVKAYGMGAVDFIAKPFIPEALRAKVAFFLELYRKNIEIRKNTARLERAIKDLEEFAYTVAHNLRAPLRSMAGFARILLDEYAGRPLDEEGSRFARRIEESGVRLDTLIRDLLSYIRLMHSPFNLGPVDVQPVIHSVLDALGPRVEELKAMVRVREPFSRVMAEPSLLGEVLRHLVSNALLYTKPGAPPEVDIRSEGRDGRVRVWVEDRGIGIAPQYHERIFGAFERLHSDDLYPGTGIGLAIVRRAADRMGGRAGVESSEGSGARFWLELKSAP